MAGKLPQSDARRAGGGYAAGDPETEQPSGEALHSFSIDRPKAWMLLATHCLLPAFILWRVLDSGMPAREDFFALVIVLAVFGFAGWSVLRELRTRGVAVVLEREGFRDYRRSPELVPWSAVAEAGMKRGILSRGVKIVLADGNRADIDTSLLAIRPRKLTGLIVELLHARQKREAEDEEEDER